MMCRIVVGIYFFTLKIRFFYKWLRSSQEYYISVYITRLIYLYNAHRNLTSFTFYDIFFSPRFLLPRMYGLDVMSVKKTLKILFNCR